MSSSVEEVARSAMENLIKELEKERDVSSKERTLRMDLITKLTEYEAKEQRRLNEIRDLHSKIASMETRIEELVGTIQSYEKNKDSDKTTDTDTKEEDENASEVEVAKEAIIKADTMDGDDSKSDGTDAAAITISESVSELEASVAKVEATEEKRESESGGQVSDKLPMNERRRFRIQVRMILRFTFRGYFGVSFSNRWGHWWDRHMSSQVWKYGYWVQYPTGHHVLKGHSAEVWAAAVSTDGRFLFTAGTLGIIIVWDLLDNSMLKQFDASDKWITCLNYECDLLVCGGHDNKIRILNGITHDLIRTFKGHSKVVMSVQFSRECTQIVSTSADKSVKIWCVKTGDCLATLTGHTETVYSAHFMNNDTRVLSGSFDASIKLWSMTDMSECDTITDGVKGSIWDMSLNCDSSLVACCFLSNGITIYNWPNMDIARSMKVTALKCKFHPFNPDILAVSNRAIDSVDIYNIRSGDKIAEWEGHTTQINNLCWSRDGYILVSVSSDHTVRVWDCTHLE